MNNVDRIRKRNIKRKKLINKIKARERYIQENGYSCWACKERKRSINKIFIIAISLPFIYILANVYYFLFEFSFFLLQFLLKTRLSRSGIERDEDNALYQNFYIKNKKIKIKLPFVLLSQKATKRIRSKSIMY